MPGSSIVDVAVTAVLTATAASDSRPVLVGDPGIAARLAAEGRQLADCPLNQLEDEQCAAIVLASDELSHAGEQAEALVDEAARALVPDGLLAATVRNRVFSEVTGLPAGLRGFTPDEFERLLGHCGFTPSLLCAPGAAGRLRATLDPEMVAEHAALDIDRDRQPGLLGGAPRLFALASGAAGPRERSKRFFATLPRKVIAAAVLCRADDGRVLVVHDTFKQHWTIPGGVVDAGEDPRKGAEREAWEEAGVSVAAGAILGVFAGSWPDRLVLVYDGLPVGGGVPTPNPVHGHEIDAAEWVNVPEAFERLAPHVAFQVRRCLAEPGGTWVQPQP